MARMKGCVAAAAVVLSLLSAGLSAPLSSCDSLLQPIAVSKEDILGRWLYIGGSVDLEDFDMLTSAWMNITATTHDNILHVVGNVAILGQCSSIQYNVTFENSTFKKYSEEKTSHSKSVFLLTNCSDCLLVQETNSSTSLVELTLYSRRRSVSPAVLEMLKSQAECLRMPSPIIIDPDYEICPDNPPPIDGMAAFIATLQHRMRDKDVLGTLFEID